MKGPGPPHDTLTEKPAAPAPEPAEKPDQAQGEPTNAHHHHHHHQPPLHAGPRTTPRAADSTQHIASIADPMQAHFHKLRDHEIVLKVDDTGKRPFLIIEL